MSFSVWETNEDKRPQRRSAAVPVDLLRLSLCPLSCFLLQLGGKSLTSCCLCHVSADELQVTSEPLRVKRRSLVRHSFQVLRSDSPTRSRPSRRLPALLHLKVTHKILQMKRVILIIININHFTNSYFENSKKWHHILWDVSLTQNKLHMENVPSSRRTRRGGTAQPWPQCSPVDTRGITAKNYPQFLHTGHRRKRFV